MHKSLQYNALYYMYATVVYNVQLDTFAGELFPVQWEFVEPLPPKRTDVGLYTGC